MLPAQPSYLPPLTAFEVINAESQAFRDQIPDVYRDRHDSVRSPQMEAYVGTADPWWIMLYANIYTVGVLLRMEITYHRDEIYDIADSDARAFVELVKKVPPERWCHVGELLALALPAEANNRHNRHK